MNLIVDFQLIEAAVLRDVEAIERNGFPAQCRDRERCDAAASVDSERPLGPVRNLARRVKEALGALFASSQQRTARAPRKVIVPRDPGLIMLEHRPEHWRPIYRSGLDHGAFSKRR